MKPAQAVRPMRIGSLFSGIGGLELGLERAGVGHVTWQVEINPFCRRVLAKHWPHVKRYEDVRSVGSAGLEPVDLVCGGFPCQDVSAAGRGAGIKEGTRSGLWFEFRRIIGELRPRFVVVENVASGAKRWLPLVRSDLHALGYGTRAFALSAFNVGAPHLRRRVFIVADSERIVIREQSGRCGGADGPGSPIPANDGAPRPLADADGERQQQSQGVKSDQWRWSRHGDGWSIEPPVRGVAHGVSGGVDRVKALGNAVVPQCAEVIGRILLST